jgi:hypothetical protein
MVVKSTLYAWGIVLHSSHVGRCDVAILVYRGHVDSYV